MKNAILWKRILNQGIGCAVGDDGQDHMTPQVVTAPIIVDLRPGDRQLICGQDWTGLSFPFPKFWVEGVLSKGIQWGALVMANRVDDGWVVEMAGVMCRPLDPRPFFYGGYRFRTDNRGNTVVGSRELMMDPDRLARDERLTRSTCQYVGAITCDTLALLGCKNVGLEPRDNDPKQVRRAIKRHGTNAHGYRYHVLVVRPPGAGAHTKGEEIGMMPRHKCRGHFAEYGPEFNKGLLFGKYAGRFYVPPHLKGKKENGIVEKDYAVKGGNA